MPQPEKTLNPGASPQAWFGYMLRKHRKQKKLTAKDLGKLVQVSDDMILNIELGKYRSCQLQLAERLDEVLGTDGLFTESWPMAFGSADADKKRVDAEKRLRQGAEVAIPPRADRILGSDTPSPSGSPAPVDRRAFLAASSLAAFASIDLASLVAPTAPPQPPARIRLQEIAQILKASDDIHRGDNAHGGGGLVGVLASRAMEWAVGLLVIPCPEALVSELHAAVARLGIVVGASHFDAYAHDDARVAFKIASECAEEAGDWHLRAKTFSFLARQAIWIGDPDNGLTYAEKGLVRSDRLTATEKAMLHSARARAFGKMRDVQGTIAAVGAADDAFAQRDPAADPPWMAYYDEAQHHGDTAHALFDLAINAGQNPGRAGRRFEIAVAGHGDDFARSRAISCTKWASLEMATGDPHRATALGHRALDDVGRLTSRRAADDLKELGRFAGQHRQLQEAAYLRERITVTLQA
ncbi:helix-turn-helix domain-containing protein [Streptomyces sp. NBC_01615]|uniref:helix-turn-helix domain-containing protein n=1 Tax=Streptomyces sp. NBC_01615 TaxID=2975898 RepID=UPI00386CB26E